MRADRGKPALPVSARRLDPVAALLGAVFAALAGWSGWLLAGPSHGDTGWTTVVYLASVIIFGGVGVVHLNDVIAVTIVDDDGIRRHGLIPLHGVSWPGRQWDLTWADAGSALVVHAHRTPYLMITPLTPGRSTVSSRFLFSLEPVPGSVATPVTERLADRLPEIIHSRGSRPARS